uniref:Uncharacterized protein n=1 Tax=Plectus sambesii TaxID=2011161 RepID=A0A914X2G1_9BILA
MPGRPFAGAGGYGRRASMGGAKDARAFVKPSAPAVLPSRRSALNLAARSVRPRRRNPPVAPIDHCPLPPAAQLLSSPQLLPSRRRHHRPFV